MDGSTPSIPGGYYLKARKIKDGWVAHSSPCIREVWDYLLREANHKDNGVCKRGQLVRSYKDLQRGLFWRVGYRKMMYSRWEIEGATKALTKATMITTTKTTRGLLITICNYNTYQNPANYEDHNERHNEDHNERHTINKNGRMEEGKKEEKRARFAPPSASEVSDYGKEISFDIDGQQFVDFYASKGWLVGKTPMKDWRAAVRTWKQRRQADGGSLFNGHPCERCGNPAEFSSPDNSGKPCHWCRVCQPALYQKITGREP